jgi:hypothetical protein
MLKSQLFRMALAIGLVLLNSPGAFGGDKPAVTKPSDLKRPCIFVDCAILIDDCGSTYATFVDQNGNKLTVSSGYPDKNGKELRFRLQDNTVIASQPGSTEEQCLLKIMKESLEKDVDPALGKVDDQDSKRYWNQKAVKILIKRVEYRCTTKREAPTGW